MLDIKRLNDAIQFAIDEHVATATNKDRPDLALTWDQTHWAKGFITDEVLPYDDGSRDTFRVVCATACCVAGNVVAQAGDKFVVTETFGYPLTAGRSTMAEVCVDRQGVHHEVSTRAIALLGVDATNEDGEDLFDGDNDIHEVIRIAQDIAEENGEVLAVDTTALDRLEGPVQVGDLM